VLKTYLDVAQQKLQPRGQHKGRGRVVPARLLRVVAAAAGLLQHRHQRGGGDRGCGGQERRDHAWGEARVDMGTEKSGRNVEAAADLALGGAVGELCEAASAES